jgi:hypothetical protein
MKYYYFKIVILITFITTIAYKQSYAQSSANYIFATSTTNSLIDMSFGTNQLIASSKTKTASSITNIGFDFWFMGIRYSQFSVNTSGIFSFGSVTAGTSANTQIGSTSTKSILSAFSFEMATGSSGKVHYKVQGTAPNRSLVVEWQNMKIGPNATTEDGNFQTIIYETSGVIELIYGNMIYRSAPSSKVVSAGFSTGKTTNLYTTIDISSDLSNTSGGATSYSLGNSTPVTLQVSSSANGSRRKYAFTPSIPSSPSNLTFTNISTSQMTLSWADNSTNEVGFVIYKSLDGGLTYIFENQVSSNVTSCLISTLSNSTQYFWKVYSVSEGALSSGYASGNQTTNASGTCTSIASGNWSSSSTWSCGAVPSVGDNVIIANGHTVTIDMNANCNSLIVGQGISGVLTFDNTQRSIIISNDVTINSGGSFKQGNSNQLGHSVTIGGSLVNNGTLDFYFSVSKAIVLTFTGSANATFSGSGGITDIYMITINKGSSTSSILELTTTNFTVRGSTSSSSNAFLNLTNGLFKLSGSFSHFGRVLNTAVIPSTAGFELNNSNFIVTTQNGTLQVAGKLIIDAGTFNVGTSSGNDLGFNTYGSVEIYGGILNVPQSICPYSSPSSYYYIQTGGVVTVSSVSNSTSRVGSFHIDANGDFSMSGGTIVLRKANTNATASNAYDYINLATSNSISGGTVQYGDGSSGATQNFNFSAGYFPNLVVNYTSAGNGSHTVKLGTLNSIAPDINLATTLQTNTTLDVGNTYSCNAIFEGDVTIGSNATFNQKNATHTFNSNFSNNGTFSTTTGTSIFSGEINQSISGTSTTAFYNLTNSNLSTGITLNSNISVANTLSMSGTIADILLNGKTIDLLSTGSISGESNTDRIYGLTGSITTTRSISNVSSLDVAGLGLILTTTANMGSTVFTRKHDENSDGTFTSILRNYLISPTNNSNLDATITFNYFDNELNNLSSKESNFVLLRSTDLGLTWTNRAGIVTAASNYVSLSGISAFSLWTVAATGGTALPIELLSFEAKSLENDVLLFWKTASELNNHFFTLERSFDGIHFTPIQRIYSYGDSKDESIYSYLDNDYINGINYYKLKQTDYNGDEKEFEIVAIDKFKEKSLLIKTVNSLGQLVDAEFRGVVFDIYLDGTAITRVQ